jgi:dual specificity MAP kinase phosphatase
MYEITPFIFLGNHQDAEENIAIAQVNCTKDLPRYNHSSKKFYRVPVNDDLQEYSFKEMTQELPGAVAFIDECVRSRERVLVHCFAGQQRSCAVIAAYFASKGIPVQTSVEYLRSRKPDAFNRGVNFQKSLDEYVKSLKV